MDGTGEYHVKCNKTGSERQRAHIFSRMWKIDPNTNTSYTYTYTNTYNTFAKVELLE
jgi:hypothetical protein